VRQVTLSEGRFIGEGDERAAAKVAVVGAAVRRLLGERGSVVGHRIRIGGVDFLVAGVGPEERCGRSGAGYEF
jgi:hypothetical protein